MAGPTQNGNTVSQKCSLLFFQSSAFWWLFLIFTSVVFFLPLFSAYTPLSHSSFADQVIQAPPSSYIYFLPGVGGSIQHRRDAPSMKCCISFSGFLRFSDLLHECGGSSSENFSNTARITGLFTSSSDKFVHFLSISLVAAPIIPLSSSQGQGADNHFFLPSSSTLSAILRFLFFSLS